ncbi:phosphoribosylglycinamide formyltransferase [Paracoccus sp. p4-l81]|uniref:phosphoribosylglycinamide formyltransferase n=1 Tax=unclassified Paracoccus (in: a-proteobacteria) TaxID=2688777 RepID=UPI0035BAAF33
MSDWHHKGTNVVILISGGGSNMVKLVESLHGDHPARCALVLSNNPGAGGLALAHELRVANAALDHRLFGKDRAAFEAALAEYIDVAEPDVICLAGFMRILTPDFVRRYQGRMLNIHPSLLPKYPGLDTHARALAAGDRIAGATVHLVTEELDNGPILGQVRVPILPDDTEATLAARVLRGEHMLYPQVLRRFVEGNTDRLELDLT